MSEHKWYEPIDSKIFDNLPSIEEQLKNYEYFNPEYAITDEEIKQKTIEMENFLRSNSNLSGVELSIKMGHNRGWVSNRIKRLKGYNLSKAQMLLDKDYVKCLIGKSFKIDKYYFPNTLNVKKCFDVDYMFALSYVNKNETYNVKLLNYNKSKHHPIVNGKLYKTTKQLLNDFPYTDLKTENISARMHSGDNGINLLHPIEFRMKVHNRKESNRNIILFGQSFKSLTEVCKYYKCTKKYVYSYYDKNDLSKLENYIKYSIERRNKLNIDGIKYKTVKEMYNKFDVSCNYIVFLELFRNNYDKFLELLNHETNTPKG